MQSGHDDWANMQPGLEVVQQPDLEVAMHEQGHSLPEVVTPLDYSAKELVVSKHPGHYPPPPGEYPMVAASETATPENLGPKKRLIWFALGGVFAIVVILAAVLGGVLGSRAAKSSSGDSAAPQSGSAGPSPSASATGNTGSGPSNSTARPQSIRQGSALSVTGWRKPDGGVESFLFYQDPQGGLRYSRCDSSRPVTGNNTCWDAPVSFNSFAKAAARLGASTLLFGNTNQPQTELFYTGAKTRLMGVNFNAQFTPGYSEDSVDQMQIFTGLNSSVTAYWPWTIYQDSTGTLFHVRDQLLAGFAPASQWDNNNINITALMTTRLAIVPMSTNFSRIALKGGYGIFYQGLDEKLAVTITDLHSPEIDPTYPLSWPTNLPSITLPKYAPMAGFSVARPSDPLQRVDTYLLYVDGSSNINLLYTDSSSADNSNKNAPAAWKAAQPASLRGVDPDTDLACLTMATSPSNASGKPVLLEPASDQTRCYFQRGGLVTVAQLNGTADWVVVGTVPIP